MNKTPASPADPVSEVMALLDDSHDALARYLYSKAKSEGDWQDLLRGVESARAALEAKVRELEKDAARYRHMRNNAVFRDRNGPGLYWYLPMFGHGGSGEQLDAAIDSARETSGRAGGTP